MMIEDLLQPGIERRDFGGRPEMDPLTEDDALQEAQLIGVRFDPLALTAGLLFDLRSALQLREANTGLLVIHGVRELVWSGPRRSGLTAWTAGASTVSSGHGLFRIRLALWPAPGAQMSIVSEAAAFLVVEVPDLGDAAPDYSDIDHAPTGDGIACWESSCRPIRAVFLDTLPADTPATGE